MATYKLTYTLQEKKWVHYVDNVVNTHDAVAKCDYEHPEIPKEAFVQIQLIHE